MQYGMKNVKSLQTLWKYRKSSTPNSKIFTLTFNNADAMDIFLETFELPKLDQEDIKLLNNPISMNKIENVIKSLPTKKSPGPDGFTVEFYKKYKGELMLSLLKIFIET